MSKTGLFCVVAACGAMFFAADVAFEKRTLSERFVAEGCDMADLDKDGKPDVIVANNRGVFAFFQQ